MRLAAVALLLVPALASADPALEFGAGVGLTQDANAATAGQGTTQAVDLYARMHVIGPFAAQVELGTVDTNGQQTVRTGSVLGVAELMHGRVVPLLLAGFGIDQVGSGMMSSDQYTYSHVELGLGLQIRISGGLTLGVDVRQGTRSVQSQPAPTPVLDNGGGFGTDLRMQEPIADGDYRTVRATLGVRF
jgi:hypothetical protein